MRDNSADNGVVEPCLAYIARTMPRIFWFKFEVTFSDPPTPLTSNSLDIKIIIKLLYVL